MSTLQYFECEVTESKDYYLVRIHPRDKELAKSIKGRSWDGEICRWVYPKTDQTYADINEVLRPVAKKFEITPPRQSTRSQYTENEQNETYTETKDGLIEENTRLRDIGNSIEALSGVLSVQSEQLERLLAHLDSQEEESTLNENGDSLDPRNPEDARKINRLIRDIMTWGSKEAGSDQVAAISNIFTLDGITEFVVRTHELLQSEILKTTSPNPSDPSFTGLITKARRERAYTATREGTLDIYNCLYILNGIRNNLAHPEIDIPRSRVLLMGITYALLISELWASIAQDE